jgi:trigger factor
MSSDQTLSPSVDIESIGPCRRKLTIEIPAETVAETLDEKLGVITEQAALPGFRAGRVPRRLVEKRFGGAVRDEAKQQLVADAFREAVQEHSLRVLGDPQGGDELKDLELDREKPVRFTVEVEVAPEFETPDLEGIEVKKPLFEVTDEMVDREIERFATHEGALEKQEEAHPGDYLLGHGVLTKDADGEVVHDIEGAVVQIPKEDADSRGMILGVMVEDFRDQIGLPKPGEKVTVKTTGPEAHEEESIRGEPITIEFTVDEVNSIIPAKPDELAAKFGMKSEDELREAIRLRLNQRIELEQQNAMRQQAARQLIERVEMDLPERLTSQQAERNLQRRRLDLMQRGVEEMEIEENLAELRSSSQELAQRELKMFFILDRIAEENDVQISEAEVNGRIAQIAASRQMRPDHLRDQLIKNGSIQGVAQQVREHKTLDFILSKAKVEEITADEYNEWARSLAGGDEEGAEAESKPAAAKKKTKKKTSKKKTTKKTSKKKSDAD